MAVPLTVAEVLLIPVPMVNCRLAGACAVMVTVPGILHSALPRLLMETMVMFDELQVRPSVTPSPRLLLLVKFPVAVKPTEVCGLLGAVAFAGATVMLVKVGCSAPHPMSKAPNIAKNARKSRELFIVNKLDGERLKEVVEVRWNSRDAQALWL